MVRFTSALVLVSCLLAAQPYGASRTAPPSPPRLDTFGIAQAFARVPGGSFDMGSTKRPQEEPLHRVSVASFDLATTEVTVGQFRAFVQATGYETDAERTGRSFLCCWRPKLGVTWRNPGFPQSDDEPVLAVSWNDAVEFCRWLSGETGLEYRLPSEAEWEFAARQDQEGQRLDSSAWFDRNSDGHSHPVGTRAAGRLGLHDILGNAWEWVADVYHDSYRDAPADGRPWLQSGGQAQQGHLKAGEGRVLRGGAWGLCDCQHPVAYEVSVTSRPAFAAAESCNNSGFRLARSIPSSSEAAAPKPQLAPAVGRVRGLDIVWIALPTGPFEFGAGGSAPARSVEFARSVRMMQDEVTVAQFRAFVEATAYVTDAERRGWAWESDFRSRHATEKKAGARWSNPGFDQQPSEPVTYVSWNDALAFCRWLSAESGRNYRLPTEAEWEYACTSGGKDGPPVPLADAAWFFDNSGFRTHPVGTRKPNAWGFRDMLGNAAEWVLDAWSPDVARTPPDGSARLGLQTPARVLRGGSFEREANEFGPRARDWHNQSEAVAGVGFRVVDATQGPVR